jgi:single stranded DNA-binding protein
MRNQANIELIGYVYGNPENPMKDKHPNFIKFSLSVTRKWKDKGGEEQKEITWYQCSSWSEGLSNIIKSHVKGGMGLLVRGAPKSRAYIDKEGVAKSQIEVNVKEINMLTYPKDDKNESDNNSGSAKQNNQQEHENKPNSDESYNDDIPF